MGPIATEIAHRLSQALQPEHLLVHDDSALHKGHGGYREGVETHLRVDVASVAFVGLGRLARQRLVLEPLADLMENPVHALSIRARAPGE